MYNDINFKDLSLQNLKFLSDPFKYVFEDGDVVGEHSGAHFFTMGQRKGLAVGGTKDPLL